MWPPPKQLYLDEWFNLYYPPGAKHGDELKGMEGFLNPHWTQFEPQSPVLNLLIGIAFIVLLTFSLLGNGCILYIFAKTEKLKTSSNIFVINLAAADLFMMSTHGLPVGINVFIDRYWYWGPLGCKLFSLLGGIAGTTSIMSMVLIGYDRCNVIVGGIAAKRISKSQAIGMCVFLWIYSVAASVPPFLGWGAYGLEGLLITCSYEYILEDWNSRSFVLYVLITHFCIPCLGLIYFYSQIVRAVSKHEAELKAQAAKMGVESLKAGKSDQSNEVKIAKVAVTNVSLWFLTWVPYAFVVFLGLVQQYHLLTPVITGLPSLLIKTTSSLNPLVFAAAHPLYREALAEKLPCLGIGKKASASSDSRTEVTNN
eukprot:TRINITY_DN33956_c0_g1_i1.p1 TRINITY_DN33956_c0_g1~~TRINITY_DN33956_c0_g1_i1.p1  ORF type:complete len:379 (-),score=61.50 TRINITY_DN33956_c0_g1_i1:400-1503(-)